MKSDLIGVGLNPTTGILIRGEETWGRRGKGHVVPGRTWNEVREGEKEPRTADNTRS